MGPARLRANERTEPDRDRQYDQADAGLAAAADGQPQAGADHGPTPVSELTRTLISVKIRSAYTRGK
jgi:hypothetical protein